MDAGTEGVTRGNAPESFPYTAPKASSSDDDKYATGTSRIKAPGDGTVDTTKARLANGEAVLNRGAAEHLGQPAIQALNAVGMMRMGMVPGKGTQDDRVAPANKAQTAGKTGAQGYAKGTSKAGPKGKSAPPAKADAKGGKADAKGKPSDTPSIDQIDPKMLAAVAQMGVLGQQAGGPDMQAAQAAQAGAAPGQTPMGMPPGAAQQPPQGGPPMGMM